jgi:type IV pilus assembly protein PilC
MTFSYTSITNTGEKKEGIVEAISADAAISALQRRGLIVISIKEYKERKSFFEMTFFETVPMKAIVIMSRQISTLFEAQVSAQKAFIMLAANTENQLLNKILTAVAEDIQAGTSISNSLAKYPETFSDFYVNMVKVGEESGKLREVFNYLADYLEREYELTSKTKNALIYPAFVIGVFIIVMTLMFVFIVPKLSAMIQESGQEIPLYTKVVISVSELLVHYGIFILIVIIVGVFYLYRLTRTDTGKSYLDRMKISTPIVKNIFVKLYLSRIADNLDTMLSAGIPLIKSLEITSAVVGNRIYRNILIQATEDVKAGGSLSNAFSKNVEIPQMMSQMIRVGEETGSIGNILKTLGHFYNREAKEAVDTLVTLIEPIMIVALGLGVGLLLASVLLPIYNIAGGIA